MNIERQKAMIKSVAKSIRQKEKQEAPKEKVISKMYKILHKYDCTLDEVNGSKVTQKEYDFLLEYFKVVRGFYSHQVAIYYPNMKR